MKKHLRYDDIEKFPRSHYQVDVGWSYLREWLEHAGEPDLDPDFQRAHVWTEDQQRAYCEFRLRGGESGGSLHWNHPNWMGSFDGKLTLVDGKQRLAAVTRFMQNDLQVFDGYYLENIDPIFYKRIGQASFRMHVGCLKTRADVLRWYLMINAGGTPHTSEELDKVRNLLKDETRV